MNSLKYYFQQSIQIEWESVLVRTALLCKRQFYYLFIPLDLINQRGLFLDPKLSCIWSCLEINRRLCIHDITYLFYVNLPVECLVCFFNNNGCLIFCVRNCINRIECTLIKSVNLTLPTCRTHVRHHVLQISPQTNKHWINFYLIDDVR